MDSSTRPSALFVHYTHTQQTYLKEVRKLATDFDNGEMRERYLGVKIPPTNLKPDYLEDARTFANHLANELPAAAPAWISD